MDAGQWTEEHDLCFVAHRLMVYRLSSNTSQIFLIAVRCILRSVTAIKIVSSPASVPTISGIAARSISTATADAIPESHLATISTSPAVSRLSNPRAAEPFVLRGNV